MVSRTIKDEDDIAMIMSHEFSGNLDVSKMLLNGVYMTNS